MVTIARKINCILQCFDTKELERIRKKLNSDLFLVQLMESSRTAKSATSALASYADGIGPWYKQVIAKKINNGFSNNFFS